MGGASEQAAGLQSSVNDSLAGFTGACVVVHVYAYVYLCVCTPVHVYVNVCVCVSVC